MRISSPAALVATIALLTAAPVADAAKPKPRAKVRTLTGQVAAAPYVAGRKVAVPVVLDRRTVRRAKLRAPVGMLMLKKSKAVRVRGQRARVAPALLRAGDTLRARAKVSRNARRALYWRMPARAFSVTKRSRTLGPAEIVALYDGLGADLRRVETLLMNLAKYVQSGFSALTADIRGLRTDLGALNAALTALEQRVAALEAGLPALEQRLQLQIAALAADVSALQGQMAALESQLAALQGDLSDVQADLAALQTTVAGLSTQVAQLQTAVGALCGPPSPVEALC